MNYICLGLIVRIVYNLHPNGHSRPLRMSTDGERKPYEQSKHTVTMSGDIYNWKFMRAKFEEAILRLSKYFYYIHNLAHIYVSQVFLWLNDYGIH
jgi:hypothetical protein